ncbi:hypothetical protein NZD89_18300 [Alicyclobacillus fastidiosus]|uniref:HTH HARE-type domain-containing protein n=1 Tax=Alicyclobacillus fastidiosus TaxID=392011 RepID=A0ABY6ZDV3_9BACL|nr:hypothetical protein [Alicyclobacillus fastidiosus]WAH40310.1 hypothetical protein NZD89_18300 [Alicyclobacillus fastidiosus]GMA61689.1 hypothetical protein GCM10025859_21290 [Alicyclobacillus fastidiosus]
MSWTHGQPPRGNQSPYVDPKREGNYRQGHNPNQRQAPTSDAGRASRPQQSNVAATFTQEGLQTFSQIFSSFVEAAIAKALPEIVERSIERKMSEILDQIRNELQPLLTSVMTQAYNATQVVGTHSHTDIEGDQTQETSHNQVVTANPVQSKPARRQTDEELEILLKVLKEAGRPLRTTELRSLAPEVKWGSNPSVKINSLIQASEGQIQRVGRGLYQYTPFI